MTWKHARWLVGRPTLTTRPSSTRHPFAMRMIPPAAIVVGSSMKRQHRPRQGVFLEQRIGVDDADERMFGRVDPRVDGVRLSAVDLVDHQKLAMRQRAIHRLGSPVFREYARGERPRARGRRH